ncbi:hypothetical protein MGYG_08280 [Nannizzia gypsea CBS 118893]|uniref:Uncharacterized protein n=1 Tax=Arthroderma gypseum (strain ATCC MYA-4604 / CBS 118893) TaxID=535722 RepID=E4V686_ARTGP|nr:hypothetical protein MGYG_08280 [Nannizzia gypsea CBS 118893]EFR05269.1 hypothetical protein MGYG_08280 [Nannizzia gypsea CBS 118893]
MAQSFSLFLLHIFELHPKPSLSYRRIVAADPTVASWSNLDATFATRETSLSYVVTQSVRNTGGLID